MPNIKIDDLKFNTEDFDDVEQKLLSDIQLCDAKLLLLSEELRLFDIVKTQFSAQISAAIKGKTPQNVEDGAS
jgi:hypothetical protein